MIHAKLHSVKTRRCRLSTPPTISLLLLAILTCLVIHATAACAQVEALTLPRNLGDLVGESQVVVQGTVSSVMLEPHQVLKNLTTLVVTLQVEEILKGQSGTLFTFRQAVLDPREQKEKSGYRVGQHLLLLMIEPSRYGLSSPAGMAQGRFKLEPRTDGTLQATNGSGNVGLFRGLNMQVAAQGLHLASGAQSMVVSNQGGPLPLDQLQSVIRTLVAGK